MFTLAKKYRRYVQRLYAYGWTGANCKERFDAGLTRDGQALRPAYSTFKTNLARFTR
jgi:hypothetical protein